MANMVMVYTGLIDVLGRWFNTWSSDFWVFLWSNSHTPAKGDDLTNYTEIMIPSGLDRQNLLGSAWGTPVQVGTQVVATAPSIVFQPTSGSGLPVTCYGFALVDMSDVKLIMAQPLDAPYTFNTVLDALTLTPKFTNDDL